MAEKIGVCISGGGAKIGFAVGVLEVMQEKGIKPDLAYGVSSGSMVTAALCYADIAFLKDTLLAIEQRQDVLKSQGFKVFWTFLTGAGKADGWYEMATMRKKLDSLPAGTPKIKGVVGYVKLKGGEIVYKSSDQVGKAEFLDAVQASCSIPAYMQSQHAGDDRYVDGGVRDVLPLRAIIRDDVKVDELHVICLSPLTPSPAAELKNIKDVALRSLDLLVNEVFQNDYKTLLHINRLVARRQSLGQSLGPELQEWLAGKRVIKPFAYIPARFICETTDFDRKHIQDGIDHGREIALQVLSRYPEQS
jgi:NTE family protein